MSERRLSQKVRPSNVTKYDIAFFIHDKGGNVRWSHLLKEFVEDGSGGHISRQKLSDYLKELCDEGLVNKTIDKKAFALRMFWRVYPVYTIAKSREKRIEELREKKDIYEFIDTASPEKMKKVRKAINRLKDK